MTTERTQASIFSPSRALLIAGVLIAITVALKLLAPNYISVELGQRLVGVLLGLLVVIYANAVPKVLLPLLQRRGDAAMDQALRRFTGMALVLGGLTFSAAWIFAPLHSAAMFAGCLLGTALLLVIVRITWGMRKAPRNGAN